MNEMMDWNLLLNHFIKLSINFFLFFFFCSFVRMYFLILPLLNLNSATSWTHLSSHTSFFIEIQSEMKISTPSDWYQLQIKHIKQKGAPFLRQCYNDSPSSFIKSQEPEHTFLPWKFKIAPHGTWKKKENHILFFKYLQNKLGVKNNEDWYSFLSQSNIQKFGGNSLITHFYNRSPIKYLKCMIPNHNWIIWKFASAPNRFWYSITSHVCYFTWLCEELKMTHPNTFYAFTGGIICEKNGSVVLSDWYNGSPEEFVRTLNPELAWIEWMFKGSRKWDNVENHKRFFDWLGGKLGFVKSEDWKRLTASHLQKFNGIGLISAYYNGRLREFIRPHLKKWKMTEDRKTDVQDEMRSYILQLLPLSALQ